MFDKAFDLAVNVLGEITNSEEYDDAFVFYNDNLEQDGVVVVLKGSMIVLSMSEYIVYKDKK